MDELEAVAVQLRRHSIRRLDGVPTLSLFIGDTAACVRCAESALATAKVPFVGGFVSQLDELAQRWLRATNDRHDLLRSALAFVEARGPTREQSDANRTSSNELWVAWRAKSSHERAHWLDHVAGGASFCSHANPRASTNDQAKHASAWLSEYVDCVEWLLPADAQRSWEQTLRWLPPECWPAVCCVVEDATQLEALVQLATSHPRLALVVVVDTTTWSETRRALKPRSRTCVEEGIVFEKRAGDVTHFKEALVDTATSRASLTASEPTLQPLRRSASDAHANATLAHAAGRPDAAVMREQARSLAERLLYELLQCHPVTRGRFALNVKMPFVFGREAAEIDLLCEELELAIEVDGYYHFQDAKAYRRDRRKDILLQTHGLWVSRYLADDVVDDGDAIIRSIAELVQHRQAAKLRGTP